LQFLILWLAGEIQKQISNLIQIQIALVQTRYYIQTKEIAL